MGPDYYSVEFYLFVTLSNCYHPISVKQYASLDLTRLHNLHYNRVRFCLDDGCLVDVMLLCEGTALGSVCH